MVVVHDYSRPDPSHSPQPDSPEPPHHKEIDDDRAFVVGLWIISGIVILIVLGIVLKATIFSAKKSSQSEPAPEIMGEQTQQGEESVPVQVQTEAPSQLPVDSQTTNSAESKKIEELKATVPGSTIYIVESGDTISGIGAKMGVAWKKIAEINGISSPYSLHAGQKLVIQPKES